MIWSLVCKPFVSQTYRGTRRIQIPIREDMTASTYVIFANLTFDINPFTNENNFIYLFSDELTAEGK